MSFFALSKKNIINRPKDEIQTYIKMIKEEAKCFEDMQMKIVVYGNSEMLDISLKDIIKDIEEKTKKHEFVVNIFFGYSAKEEIEDGIVYKKRVDVLIRTSGERRFSDFLLWQVCGGCNVVFCKRRWPEMGMGLLSAILMKCEIEKKLYY